MTNVYTLDEQPFPDEQLIGGKALRLAYLRQHRIRVLPGYVLSSDVHLHHLATNGLSLSTRASLVTASSLDDSLVQSLQLIVSQLGGRVVVRSSAPGEDVDTLPGVYVSVIGADSDSITRAVLDVWASAHVGDNRSPAKPRPMAVLIQPLLFADWFGVAARLDSGTDADRITIEVGRSADSVTAGVTQVYTLSTGGDILDTVAPSDNPPEADMREFASIGSKIVRLLERIEQALGSPCDVEFGILGSNEIVVLQARPFQFGRAPVQAPETPAGSWTLDRGHYPRPLTPLFESIFAPATSRASASTFERYGVFARSVELRSIGGWPYVRVVPLRDSASTNLPGIVIGLVARCWTVTRRRLRASSVALRDNLPDEDTKHWRGYVLPRSRQLIGTISKQWITRASDSDLLDLAQRLHDQIFQVIESNYETDFAQLLPLSRFSRWMNNNYGWNLGHVMRVVEDGSSADGTYLAALVALRGVLSHDEAFASALEGEVALSFDGIRFGDGFNETSKAAVEKHVSEWGFFLLGFDLDDPTVGEVDQLEWNAIRDLDSNNDYSSPDSDSLAEIFLRGDETAKMLYEQSCSVHPLRTEGESMKAILLGALRCVALEIGRRKAGEAGNLGADLALLLRFDELIDTAMSVDRYREIVTARERSRKDAIAIRPLPQLGAIASRSPNIRFLPPASREVHEAVLLMGQNEVAPPPPPHSSSTQGVGVSRGRATGVVRIVDRADDLANVRSGEVIITGTASPAWISGLSQASGLICETGGMLSHAAFIARHLRIPAVMSVPMARQNFSDGEVVMLDGDSGTVRLISVPGGRAASDGPVDNL